MYGAHFLKVASLLVEPVWRFGHGWKVRAALCELIQIFLNYSLSLLYRAERRWSRLTNALAGLFCASLNFVDWTRTIRPQLTFQPATAHDSATLQRLHLLHGSLPREPVCTENLTPFLKLLPCKGKAGIATLLDGHRLFDAQWQAMALDMAPVYEDGQLYLEMIQRIDMVIDVERSTRRNSMIDLSLSRANTKCSRVSYPTRALRRSSYLRYQPIVVIV